MSTEQREPFDWPRAIVVMLAGLVVVAGLAVAKGCRRIVERVKEAAQ